MAWQAVMVISLPFARTGLAVDVWLSSGQGDIRQSHGELLRKISFHWGGRGEGGTFLPKFITWIQSWRTSEKPKLRERKQLTYTQEPSGISIKMKPNSLRKAECKDEDHLGSWQLCFATKLINLISKFNQNLHGLLFKPSELFHFIAHIKKSGIYMTYWGRQLRMFMGSSQRSRPPQALIWLPQGLRRLISQSTCNQPAAHYRP